MRSKLSVVLFTAVLVAVLLSASVLNAADSKHPRTTFKVDRAPKFMIPFERGPADMTPGPTDLNTPVQKYAFAPPGSKVGATTYDYQHNGSMGRMCATDLVNNQMIFVWMAQTNFTIPGDRLIRGQIVDLNTGENILSANGDPMIEIYSGYCSAAPLPSAQYGGSSMAYHMDPSGTGTGQFKSVYQWDGSVYYGATLYTWLYETTQWNEHTDWEVIWPIVETHFKDTTDNLPAEDVVYMLSHVGPDDPSEAMVLYRRVGSLDDTTIVFDSGAYIDLCTDLSYIIVADRNSNDVAIVYTSDRGGLAPGAGGQTDMDVYYRMSTDQGVSWGEPINVSNYTEDSLWRAYTDLSAVFTDDGILHVIWNARELRDANTYENYKCRLMHADNSAYPTFTASVIDEARYDMKVGEILCDPGAWNLYIAKMSLSSCDGNMYALYTKFGDDNEPGALYDCSHAHMANGELYLAASDDGGQTWDTAWNITKTRTPACDSNECMSEHWSSMAMYGFPYGGPSDKDTLDIQYIYDKDAGGIPQGEGTWCVNDVMHYRFPCRDVAHIPRPSYEPNQFLDPLHTLPSTPLTITLKIQNIGNAPLDISSITPVYTNGTGWISVGAGSQNPIPLQGFATYDITFNAGGILDADPSGWEADLQVSHNGPSITDHIPVHLTVATDFNMPQNDTLFTTTKKLMVYSTGRLGGDNDYASLDIPDDCDDTLSTPNSKIFLYDASPMITYDRDGSKVAYTAVFTQLFTESGTFRPQSDLNWITETDYNLAVCTLSTTDSLFGVGVEVYGPTDGNDFVIAKYDFTTWKPGLKGTDAVNVGFVADWDIPADRAVDNGSGYDDATFSIWQNGREVDTLVDDEPGCPIYEYNRFGGIRVISGTVKTAWTAENAPMQVGSGFSRDSLFARMTDAAGYHISPTLDTIDLHTGICFDQVDLTAKATYSYVIAIATSNDSLSGLTSQLDAAYNWAVSHGIYNPDCCNEPGDANDDGAVDIGDAVHLINYIFKSGPPPPCLNEGDANGDCAIDIGDAVHLINYIFKSGPAPVCGCVP